jgi:hypothetical protein
MSKATEHYVIEWHFFWFSLVNDFLIFGLRNTILAISNAFREVLIREINPTDFNK